MDRKSLWISSIVGTFIWTPMFGNDPRTAILMVIGGGVHLFLHWLASDEWRDNLKKRLRPGE